MDHPQDKNNQWQIQDASAKFSQLVRKVETSGTQFITKRGNSIAVIMSKEKYDELIRPSKSLIDFFAEAPLIDVDLDLSRSIDLPREIDL